MKDKKQWTRADAKKKSSDPFTSINSTIIVSGVDEVTAKYTSSHEMEFPPNDRDHRQDEWKASL